MNERGLHFSKLNFTQKQCRINFLQIRSKGIQNGRVIRLVEFLVQNQFSLLQKKNLSTFLGVFAILLSLGRIYFGRVAYYIFRMLT